MGGGGACAVLAHRMPLPSVDSSSWPIACLSLVYVPRHGPSHASPLGGFLVMAHRTPLPWVHSSSWPIERLSLGWLADRTSLPCVRSSSWPIACLSLGWIPRHGPSNASPLALGHVPRHGPSNASPFCGLLQQDSATLIPTKSFINS